MGSMTLVFRDYGIKVTAKGHLPKQNIESDSGFDIFAHLEEPLVVPPCHEATEATLIPTGLVLELPPRVEGQIRPSANLSKQGLMVILGTIDPGFTEEIFVLVANLTNRPITIDPDRRIAKLVFNKITPIGLVRNQD